MLKVDFNGILSNRGGKLIGEMLSSRAREVSGDPVVLTLFALLPLIHATCHLSCTSVCILVRVS